MFHEQSQGGFHGFHTPETPFGALKGVALCKVRFRFAGDPGQEMCGISNHWVCTHIGIGCPCVLDKVFPKTNGPLHAVYADSHLQGHYPIGMVRDVEETGQACDSTASFRPNRLWSRDRQTGPVVAQAMPRSVGTCAAPQEPGEAYEPPVALRCPYQKEASGVAVQCGNKRGEQPLEQEEPQVGDIPRRLGGIA